MSPSANDDQHASDTPGQSIEPARDIGSLLATDVMQPVVRTAAPEWPLASLERFFIDNELSGVAVVDDGQLIGMVSRSDVVRQLCVERTEAESLSDYYRDQSGFSEPEAAARSWQDIAASVGIGLDELTVADVMSKNVLSVTPGSTVRAAAELMVEHRIHRVPVVDGPRLIGLISALDIVGLIGRPHG